MTLSAIEKVTALSSEMEQLLDFIASDEALGEDFQSYVDENNIKIEKQSELNVALVEYLLDGKMQDGTRVLDYYKKKCAAKSDIVVEAFLHSIASVFEIKKVLKNAYETYSLTSEREFCLIPLVKMTNLRGISRGDFIRARVIELEGEFFLLEIYDIISSLNYYHAGSEAIKCMISNSKSAIFKNEKKEKKIKDFLKDLKSRYESSFKDYKDVITTNKLADDLISAFNDNPCDVSKYIIEPDDYKYFEVEEFISADDFIKNAAGGFSSHKSTYDVGLFFDEKEGLFIVPFLGTFYKIFERQVEGAELCIREFLKSDKVPKGVIALAAKRYKNFLVVINSALETNFKSTVDVIEKFKGKDETKISPTVVLYNSKVFSDMLGLEDIEEKSFNSSHIGRNDLCPCGSGKKFKKCCGAN